MVQPIAASDVKRIGSKPGGDLSGTSTTVAHVDRDHIIMLAWRDPHRYRFFDIRTLIFKGHGVLKLISALCVDKAGSLRSADLVTRVVALVDAKFRGRFRTDQGHVVPSDLI